MRKQAPRAIVTHICGTLGKPCVWVKCPRNLAAAKKARAAAKAAPAPSA